MSPITRTNTRVIKHSKEIAKVLFVLIRLSPRPSRVTTPSASASPVSLPLFSSFSMFLHHYFYLLLSCPFPILFCLCHPPSLSPYHSFSVFILTCFPVLPLLFLTLLLLSLYSLSVFPPLRHPPSSPYQSLSIFIPPYFSFSRLSSWLSCFASCIVLSVSVSPPLSPLPFLIIFRLL